MILESKKWLKTADVIGGETITFKSEGEWIENKRYTYPDGAPRQDFVIKVDFNGDIKDMRLNKTNRDTLVNAYGKDTLAWIDQTARLTKVRGLVGGKMMDMVILEVA
jgi:hypothetical protein